jgi:hypothetical protein
MKDLGLMHYFLGLEVWQRSNDIFLSQGKYTVEILQRFKMMDYNSMATPMVMNLKILSDFSSDLVDPTMYRQLIASLMYLLNTRLNICFAVNTLNQYMVETRHAHFVATKHVLRYLQGTVGYGLIYVLDGEVKMQGYIDSDWVRSAMYRKITSGCHFSLGSSMILWLRIKQSSVALSTTEEKYIESSASIHEVVWISKFLAGLFDLYLDPTLIYCDNQSCVNISNNPLFHDKSKNIDIKYHFIQDMVWKGALELRYISIDKKITNILTKPLSRVKYKYFRDNLGVKKNVHPH